MKNKILGVVLAGGYGTRLNPFTEGVTNKHLAPIYSGRRAVPMIEFPLSTLKNIGITDILVITSKEHCGDIAEYLGDGYELGLDITYKIQAMNDPNRPPGIASALKLARDYTGDNNFVVILGDNFFEWNDCFKQLVIDFNNTNQYSCGLFLKPTDKWARYGVAVLSSDSTSHIKEIIEKPRELVSDLAVTGMYIYTKDVYNYIDTLTPSNRGELEISHINSMYCQNQRTKWIQFDTFWNDMGTPETILEVQNYINNSEKSFIPTKTKNIL